MNIDRRDLTNAIRELNEILQLTPPINLQWRKNLTSLKKVILDAIFLLEDGDKISYPTMQVIEELMKEEKEQILLSEDEKKHLNIKHLKDTKTSIDKKFSSVYYLFNNEELVYVGASDIVHARINAHKTHGLNFNYYNVIYCENRKRALELEKQAIRFFKPRYNGTTSGLRRKTRIGETHERKRVAQTKG